MSELFPELNNPEIQQAISNAAKVMGMTPRYLERILETEILEDRYNPTLAIAKAMKPHEAIKIKYGKNN